MAEVKNGMWVKYDAAPNEWGKIDGSYRRLFNDLKGSNTGWFFANSLSKCEDELCGEMIPSNGTVSGDIYVYYITDGDKKIPKIYIKVSTGTYSGGKLYEIRGSKDKTISNIDEYYLNHEVEVSLLPVLLSKLNELKVTKKIISDYEVKNDYFKRLVELKENGIKTDEDIICLYKNFKRLDTDLAFKLMKDRNVQDDYDSLSDENKIEFLKVFCDIDYSSCRNALLCKALGDKYSNDSRLLVVDDESKLIATATDTSLKCLSYASDELIGDKDSILRILDNFELYVWSSSFADYIPGQYRTDIDVLQTATKTDPLEMKDLLYFYLLSDDDANNMELKMKLEDMDFCKNLLTAYFNNVLSNEELLNEQYVNMDLLYFMPEGVFDVIENELLYGPESTLEREGLKQKIYSKTMEVKNIRDKK